MHLNEALVLPDSRKGVKEGSFFKKKTAYPFSDFGKF